MIYYEVITKKNMPQYRDVMLPVAYEEIASLEMEPIEMGYLCIGARDDKSQKTAGSVVATLGEEDGEGTVMVQSLFVRQKNRRKEVGSTLLSRLLTVCSDIYQFPEGVDSAPVTLKLQYALPDPDAEAFTAFLLKFGVTDFAEEAPVFRMSEWDLMQLDMLHPESKGNPKVRPFSEAGDELIGEINELTGHVMDPDLSFAYVKEDDILGMVVTEELAPGQYLVIDAEHDENLSDMQMVSLIRTTALALQKKTPQFTVTLEPKDPILRGILLGAPGVVKITPRVAWADVELTRE